MIQSFNQKISVDRSLLLQYALTTILLSIPAFYNKYPLFFSDSGTYLVSLFDKRFVPMDRPFGYGFMMRFVSMKLSLWPIILFQNLVATILIRKIITRFFEIEKVKYIHMIACAVLLISSSLPWYSNQIMPDIITSFIILVVYLFFTSTSIFRWFYAIVLLFFLITHFSHFPILLLSTLTIALFMYLYKLDAVKSILIRSSIVCGVLFMGFIGISAQSYVNNQGFVFSHCSAVFLSGRLSETGLLKTYLQDNCDSKPSPLCVYTDSLSTTAADFIWNEESALNKVLKKHFNGREASSEEEWHYLNNEVCKPIVDDIITTPTYFVKFCYYGLRDSFIQFFQINIGSGFSQYGYNSAPYWPMSAHLTAELPIFLNSVQNTREIDFDFLNILNYLVLLLSCFIIWFAWVENHLSDKLKVFFMFILCSIYWNAFVTAALANIYTRLQARVTWLFVLVAIIVLFKSIHEFRKQRSEYVVKD